MSHTPGPLHASLTEHIGGYSIRKAGGQRVGGASTTPPGQAPVYRYVSDRLANAQENARTILARVKGE